MVCSVISRLLCRSSSQRTKERGKSKTRARNVRAVTPAQHVVAAVGLAACWGAFAVTWAAGALYNAMRGPRRSFRAPTGRTVVASVVVCLVAVAVLRTVPAGDWAALEIHSAWTTAIGLALLLASTAFAVWARYALGTMWSLDPIVKQGHRLRTDGPYALT